MHFVRTILSYCCAIPSLSFHYQCVSSCVYIWCWLLCRYACESEQVLFEEAKVPMIAILFSSSVGMSIEWQTGVLQVVGSLPDVFSFDLNFIKALVYTLCEDNLVPWLRYSFSDISLSVFLFMCVCIWCWLLCRYACKSERVLCEEAKVPMIATLLSSSVGMPIEWLTVVSQVVGSLPDMFSFELKFIKALVYYIVWGQSCHIVVLFILWHFIISVSFHVFVYDIGCFVDMLASWSGYCVRKLRFQWSQYFLAPRWVCW